MKEDISDLDFEISFYESLLKNNHNSIPTLIALGDSYTKRGFYDKGLEIDKRLSQLKPDDPVVFYNLACSYSLLNQADEAIETLLKAIELGYNDLRWLQQDPDLEAIRKTSKYNLIIKKLFQKKQAI